MKGTSSAKLVAVGDNCLDVYLTRGLLTVGGNALNVAVQWRRNGWHARYFGAVGNDTEGDIVLEETTAAGLSGGDVERRPGDTAVTLLRDNAGDRKFLLESFGVGEDYRPATHDYRSILNADWVHLGTNANRELLRLLVADKVLFSVDVSTAHFALPLEGVPLLFASGPDDAAEPVEPLLAAFRKAGARTVVLTCGARGVYFDDGSRLLYQKAAPVEVVDTCGAGDSFIAVFLTSFCLEQRAAEEALYRATAAASATCTYLGGFPQTPRPIPNWLRAKYAQYITQEQDVQA
jgi:fructoselysine 6-kinase